MPPTDRVVLRNLIIVMLVSTGGGLALGTSCLGRDRTRQAPSTTLEHDGVRPPASGAPASAAGSTTITSAPLHRGRPAMGMSPRMVAETPDAFEPSFPQTRGPTPMFRGGPPAPMPMASPPPNTAPLATQHSGMTPPPPSVAPPATQHSGMQHSGMTPPPPTVAPPATSAPMTQQSPHPLSRTPTQGLEAGAGPVVTEPTPFSASALSPNPEAGAGPGATDQAPPPAASPAPSPPAR